MRIFSNKGLLWVLPVIVAFLVSCSSQPVDINARLSPGRLLDDRLLESAVRSEIASVLKRSEELGSVRAVVFNGSAFLVGTVINDSQKKRIIEVVNDFRHIQGVHSEIKTHADYQPLINVTDKRIETQANVRLSRNPTTRDQYLRVVAHAGEIFLIGIATRKVGEVAVEQLKFIRGINQVVVLLEYLD